MNEDIVSQENISATAGVNTENRAVADFVVEPCEPVLIDPSSFLPQQEQAASSEKQHNDETKDEKHHDSSGVLYSIDLSPETSKVSKLLSAGEVFVGDSADKVDVRTIPVTAVENENNIQSIQPPEKARRVLPIQNFVKQILFSPDGTCLISNSNDDRVRIFEIPYSTYSSYHELVNPNNSGTTKDSAYTSTEWKPTLVLPKGETVHSMSWYPRMDSREPQTCCFATSSRDHPVQLWDAFSGQLRCSYVASNHLEEIVSANSIQFNLSGDKIFAGYERMIRIFDTGSPGKAFQSRPTSKTRKSRTGQRGIISSLGFNPDHSGVFAAGSFSGVTCIYEEKSKGCLLELQGQGGGVTHVQFSPNGQYLCTGGRRDPYILCWDIRNTLEVLWKCERVVSNNQKIYFDIDPSGTYLLSGSQDNRAIVYNMANGSQVRTIDDCGDAVNGTAFHPTYPFFAISTGQRHYSAGLEDEDIPKEMNSIQVYGSH